MKPVLVEMNRVGFGRLLRELSAGWSETAADFRRLWAGADSSSPMPHMTRTVAAEQFRQLMQESPANFVATLLAAFLWLGGFRWMGSPSYLGWSLLGFGLVGCLMASYIVFTRTRPADHELGRWESFMQRCIFASGVVWGSAAFVPAPAWTLPYVAMGVLLMVAGGLSLFATYRPGISLYAVPTMLLPGVALIIKGGPLGLATGLGFAVAVLFMARIARAHNTSITQTMLVAEERKQLVEELGVHRREAERANLAKTFFLASVTHDLRQPLHSISLLASAARARGTADSTTVEQIDASAQSMETLLAALLEVSRLDSGSVPLHVTVFAIDAMLERVRLQFQPQAKERGLQFAIAARPWHVCSDFFQLERIVSNLVANALRYTHAGGVRVRCRQRAVSLWIQVWDSGIGIPASDRERVFEEFFQVSRGTRGGSQGLGLGLAIVQRAAHRLGHRVRVRSRPGRGSMFEVCVPIAAIEAGSVGPGARH